MFLTSHEAVCSCDSLKAVDVFGINVGEVEFSTTERFSESASVMKWSEIKTKVTSPTNHNATGANNTSYEPRSEENTCT